MDEGWEYAKGIYVEFQRPFPLVTNGALWSTSTFNTRGVNLLKENTKLIVKFI
jgi:hypothetical protein